MERNILADKSQPPYLLGLLCLIPLVGAFVGLGLLLYGILKYKDKWLSIIGAAGILITVAVYGSLFYMIRHSSFFKENMAEISQTQLNNLVKNIEFYKIQHGQYPDSLPQLLQDDELAPIYDAAFFDEKLKSKYYNYRRLDDKYTLSSSGQDGIPSTNDDMYPHIIFSDSSKIGLIIDHHNPRK